MGIEKRSMDRKGLSFHQLDTNCRLEPYQDRMDPRMKRIEPEIRCFNGSFSTSRSRPQVTCELSSPYPFELSWQ